MNRAARFKHVVVTNALVFTLHVFIDNAPDVIRGVFKSLQTQLIRLQQ